MKYYVILASVVIAFIFFIGWAIDEFKYWTMGWPVAETTVINRARVDAPEPWKEG